MTTTADLLEVQYLGRSPRIDHLAEVSERLVAKYGVPTLGNFRDPVKEIFYILLSAKTTDAQYRATHRKLWTTFPSLSQLGAASIPSIRSCILTGGLAGKRARQIKRTARRLIAAGGENPSQYLKSLEPRASFDFIRSLPGMGPKSALCVLMCSLGIDAFPVDVNVQRIAERLGVLKTGLKHYQAQERLARVVPPGRAKELHIGMVVHGRTICLPRKPKCRSCPLVDLCNRGRKEMKRDGIQKA
ncbi:MAG TPA: hypothetical protein VGI99_13990 [Gemmataceae bacterium]